MRSLSTRRPSVLRTTGPALITAFAILVLPVGWLGSGAAHVKTDSGKWYFHGMTREDGQQSHRSDPLNIIFKGGGGDMTTWRVENHIEDHSNLFGTCGSRQRVIWTRHDGAVTSDKDDFQMATRPCPTTIPRWHLRGWDDQEHDLFTGNHGPRDQWVVVGIHHDSQGHGAPDVDWDVARRELIEAMDGHCSWPKWRKHPGAAGTWQGHTTFGWIGRISMAPTPNC